MLIQVLNGVVYGGLLYLLAVGLVLIFGLREIVNFAHGALFMLGSYIGFSIAAIFDFWLGLAGAIVAMTLVGLCLDAGVLRPLRKHDHMVTVLVTFGILLVLETFATAVWGKAFRSMQPPELLSGTVELFGEPFPVYRLFVIAVSLCVAGGLTVWLRHSRIGLYVRASSVDPTTTGILGVDTDRLSLLVVGLGTGLAGMSGVIAAPLMALSPTMGNFILIESFIVVVVGGLGSFSGAFIAALLIGQIHNMGAVYLPWASTLLPFLLMVCVLIWRPTGIAGGKG
ncbi:High-affinity branched-chain amino acid transport system permease protein LivH [Oceanibacterium hippocampi]|uniref:High-affinity branched-chain amino acid transport system permease protein LivH n=2 Tax=Oceanibacterium hippocampi TaxID=745714 RepID=A0A1Y5TXN6_9PROT|nr:High-affinity branched-chain amino acid transport system permease protein LivH [Oceanibacterium hippocampi]